MSLPRLRPLWFALSLFDRLNMFYMILEKVQGFAQGKYDVNVTTAQIGQEYEEKRSDAWERIESMSITKRIVSTCASVYCDNFCPTSNFTYNIFIIQRK